jgi:NAD(P)-dependent dehydrogenase (short-subunit alcohol dehydrogenase family)
VTDQSSVDAAATAIREAEGHLDVLVNNAGISGQFLPATQGAEIIVRVATIGADGPTGTFQDRNGAMPW